MADKTKIAYWYKAQTVLLSGIPAVFEGACKAHTAGAAVNEIEEKAKVWNTSKVNSLRIYQIDPNGVLAEDYELAINYDAHARQRSVCVSKPEKDDKPSVINILDNVPWANRVAIQTKYTTVKLNDKGVIT